MSIVLYTVLPCYNEEEIINKSAQKVYELYQTLLKSDEIDRSSRILFVDDGSRDKTWDIISMLSKHNDVYQGIRLSKNKGHQIAIFAGMQCAVDKGADCVVTIDADLQQDIEALPRFLEKFREGCDVVYGVRDSRATDGFFKRTTAAMYYSLLNLLGCNTLKNSADYRLLSARAVEALSEYKESNLFIRGLVPEIGFKSDIVEFHVSAREAGESKYTLRKMITLALDGITSFSIKPIRLVLLCGIITSVISVVMMIITLLDYIKGVTVPGWSTLTISIWFLGGGATLINRCFRRICRQNLYGIQKQTEIFYL